MKCQTCVFVVAIHCTGRRAAQWRFRAAWKGALLAVAVKYNGRMMKATYVACRPAAVLPILALLAAVSTARVAHAQGASHEEGHADDKVHCSSGKPDVAIVACTHIIDDRHEEEESKAIALRNR